MKEPREVIAYNLPTFAECYKRYVEVEMPSLRSLRKAADGIIAALEAEGYVIVSAPTAIEQPLRDWLNMQSAWNTAALYSAAMRYFGIQPVIPD